MFHIPFFCFLLIHCFYMKQIEIQVAHLAMVVAVHQTTLHPGWYAGTTLT